MLSGEAGESVTLMLVRLPLVRLDWGPSMEPKGSPWCRPGQAQGVLQEGDGLSAHGSGLPGVVDQEGYGHMGHGLGRGRGRACRAVPRFTTASR